MNYAPPPHKIQEIGGGCVESLRHDLVKILFSHIVVIEDMI